MSPPVFWLAFSLLSLSVETSTIANIVNANFSAGSAFSQQYYGDGSICMCSCIQHPHCLSISLTRVTNASFYCKLFATYPRKSTQLTTSPSTNVSIYTDRALNAVYINNGTQLSNPSSLFSNDSDVWTPALLLYAGNNQTFLWFNSSNSTTFTEIPPPEIKQTAPHWFSILISQWNQAFFRPSQVAVAFIVNQSTIFEFVVFNSSQTNILSWFSITSLISSQYWIISNYRTSSQGQTQMTAIYTDSDCTRSFNANFKFSNSSCGVDFIGFFFVYGGYRDLCIAAVRNISQVPIPTIYYSPTSDFTNGNLSNFQQATGLMLFVR